MLIHLAKGSLTVEETASLCGGILARDGKRSLRVCCVCTDSREAVPGSLFVAIRGARSDGHRFIPAVAAQGAAAVIAEYLPEDIRDIPVILTESSVAAVGRLAENLTKDNRVFRVAVTGSVGKTTTKEMIAAVLGKRNCFRSAGNYNSILGMPMSLLSMPEDSGCAVFELGLGECGEISRMSRICAPSVAVVTNVGSSHLEHVGSRAKLLYEKISVKDGLRPGGVLLLDRGLAAEAGDLLADMGEASFLTFSATGEPNADYRAVNVREKGAFQTFDIVCPSRNVADVSLRMYGRHNVQAALIAAAVGDRMGLPADEIREGIFSCEPVAMRQQLLRAGGCTVINDCYNASPESMRAACDVLCGNAFGEGRRFALLGDMFELGSDSARMHYETGRYFASHGIDGLFTFGKASLATAEGAGSLMAKERILTFEDREDALAPAGAILSRLRPGDVLLVKASRAMAAERITDEVVRRLNEKYPADAEKKPERRKTE